ncbi:rhodanese-like domain-containing protein [Periweissella fabalis]|uniref:Rhodanese-like domain-containing protein n=1 Tax=Periweissella fabalis TaxID=1070421 RepID=A0A7X6N501_9LACO|nr:rhodanese-like domain-containing protein [Periweissella fabalis]MCM0599860.1 rhodanese-like domain-containing protein [Periweissella fabalis]NKZ24085.1 rhodanese-like domain-containing protein [Periweissella fabalis]
MSNEINHISTDELATKLNDNITLIDVREPAEFAAGHIAQAVNVPLSTIASYQGAKDEELYVFCRSGNRSQQAANTLATMGYQPTNVDGGILNWHGEVISD